MLFIQFQVCVYLKKKKKRNGQYLPCRPGIVILLGSDLLKGSCCSFALFLFPFPG